MRRWVIVLVVPVVLLAGVAVAGFVALQRIDWNEYKEPIAEIAQQATGRRLDLGGDLDLEIGLRPGVKLAGLSLQNAAWGSRPEMVTVERVAVRFELLPLLFGELVVNRIEVVGLDLLLETRADGAVNWDFGEVDPDPAPPTAPPEDEEAKKVEEGDALSTVLRHALIEDAVVVLRDAATGEEQRIVVRRLLARAEDASAPLEIELDLEYGVEPIRLSGKVAGVPQLLAGGPLALDLALEAGGASITLVGDVAKPLAGSGLALDLSLKTERLARLGAVAGVELPDLGPIDLALSVAGGGDAYEIGDLTLAVGTSRITGRVDVALGGERPRATAKLVASRIDLADFQGRSVEARPAGDPPPERLFGDEPLPFDSLALADAKLELEADELRSGSFVLSAVELEVRLEDRVVDVAKFAAELAGGRVDVALRVDASRRRPRVSLAGKVRSVDVGRLVASQGSQVLSGGPLDLDFDLVGRGGSVRDIMASLTGRLSLQMGAATLADETAGLVLSDLKRVLQGEAGATTAQIRCAWADFDVDDGIARSDGIVVDLSSIVIFGAGKIDLRRERLDLEFDRQAQSLSVSDVLPPFTLKGPLTEPSAGIAAGALGARIVDLGASLLGDDRAPVKKHKRPAGCKELLARYQQDQAERGSSADVARKTAGDLSGKAGKTGKKVFKELKGLFGR